MAYQYILGGAIASVIAAYFMFIKLRTEKNKASLKKYEDHNKDGESLDGSSDVIIVGAGVAGAALAYSLGKDGRKVHVIERNLSEHNRISGELLHPGGYLKLVELGLEDCLNGIDAQELHGFVTYKEGKYVKLPFTFKKLQSDHVKGRTFHNGRFVQRMREICASLPNIKMEEGTVTSLVKENGIVKGARYKTRFGEEKIAHASLTVVCDGIFSNLRKVLCNPQIYQASHLVGWVVKKREVEHPNQAYVIYVDPSPILFYPISSTHSRCFVILPNRQLPSISNGEFAHYLRTVVASQVPPELSSIFTSEIDTRSMRTMPNSRMPASPNFIPGAILLGDALNMRHPHTAGGMTVALNDVVILRDLLRHYSHHLNDVDALHHHLQSFYSLRKPMAITIETWSALTDIMIRPPTEAMKEIHQLQIDFLNIRFVGISPAEVAMAMISGINPSIVSMFLLFFCCGMYIAARSLVEFRTTSCLWKRARSIWVLGGLIVATVWTNGIRKGSTETTV